MTMLRYVCNRVSCRSLECPRHPTGQDENIPRIDLCGANQCALWDEADALNPRKADAPG